MNIILNLLWFVFGGFIVTLAYLLGVRLEGGLLSAWIGGTVYVLVLSVTLVWRFRSGAWQRIQI